MSTSLLVTASQASYNLAFIERSTALLANRVAMATRSAVAYRSAMLLVMDKALVITRIRLSPDDVVWKTPI